MPMMEVTLRRTLTVEQVLHVLVKAADADEAIEMAQDADRGLQDCRWQTIAGTEVWEYSDCEAQEPVRSHDTCGSTGGDER